MVCLKELNVDKGARKGAIPAAAEKPVSKLKSYDSTFSKPFIICSSFQTSIKGPILVVIGPSGTGKTSPSPSVKARPLQRISLGGIRDEAQICAYVASSREFIIQVFHIASCIDLVILLNEVDKLAKFVWRSIHYAPGSLGFRTELELQ